MALVGLDDEFDEALEKFVKENRVDYPSKTFYLNQLVKKDLEKRGVLK